MHKHILTQRKEIVMQFSKFQTKRHFISGKLVIGIDPSKEKYDAAVIDPLGLLQGKTFSFKNTHDGLDKQLWNCLNSRVPDLSKENTVFAIEAACNLWQKLSEYLMTNPIQVSIDYERGWKYKWVYKSLIDALNIMFLNNIIESTSTIRLCENCNAAFIAGKKNQRYCNSYCNDAARSRRYYHKKKNQKD